MVEENKHGTIKFTRSTPAFLVMLCAATMVSVALFSYHLPLETLLTFAFKTALVLAMVASLALASIFGGIVLFESWLDENIN